MARIPLADPEHFALVDAEDAPQVLAKGCWNVRRKRTSAKLYVQNNTHIGGRWQTVALHQFVMHAEPGQFVDHRNGNGLDNRKENLRFATPEQNSQNVTRSANQKRGGFKGVVWNRRGKKWEARIGGAPRRANGSKAYTYLGLFESAEEAARAYDRAALARFGEFAALNFPAPEV